jgi:hypothetical protein
MSTPFETHAGSVAFADDHAGRHHLVPVCVRWRTFWCLHAGERALVRRGLVCYRRPVTVKPARAGQIWGTSTPEH